MKQPAPPPDLLEFLRRLAEKRGPERVVELIGARPVVDDYAPWDKVRYRKPPHGLTVEEWWAILRMRRDTMARQVPLSDVSGREFCYALPDEVLRLCDEIGSRASGSIAAPEPVTNPDTRDRYLVSSLFEEAITSSQLEGAATTRQVAKEMLRTERAPRTRSEQMILNNYRAMRHVREMRDESFTPARVLELHRIVTEGTLDDPNAAGRIQSSADPADRVAVYDSADELVHRPPPVDQLERRLDALCAFANGAAYGWIHPVLRALTVHFIAGYDHYFEDGNGRTARALFYWSMLKEGYWLTEYVTVSSILKKAPSQYVKSYIHTEQDSGDLTYFFLYHLSVIKRALDQLDEYLAMKVADLRHARQSFADAMQFNSRQLALLELAVREPDSAFTSQSHANSHGVTNEAARKDLHALEDRGLLVRTKAGRKFVWRPASDIKERLG